MLHCSNTAHSRGMPHPHKPVRVFIAEDSCQSRDRVALTLDAGAITVVGRAKTPQDSIEGILATYPDVVVLDVELDGGAGLQVLRAVRHVAPNIAFVVFGSSSSLGDRNCYLCEGADDFLDKSHEFDQLANAVAKAAQHATY